MVNVNEMFKDVDWGKVEVQEDFENEIVALRGDYKGEVKDFKLIETETGAFYSLNIQIKETVKGIKGDNRYVSRSFNLAKTDWATEEENKDKLLSVLKTIGAKTPEEAKGMEISMKIRPNGDKKDKGGWPKHIVTIVKELKTALDDANVADSGTSALGF